MSPLAPEDPVYRFNFCSPCLVGRHDVCTAQDGAYCECKCHKVRRTSFEVTYDRLLWQSPALRLRMEPDERDALAVVMQVLSELVEGSTERNALLMANLKAAWP